MPGLSRRRRATCGARVGSHFSTGSWQCDCIVQLDARDAGRRDTHALGDRAAEQNNQVGSDNERARPARDGDGDEDPNGLSNPRGRG